MVNGSFVLSKSGAPRRNEQPHNISWTANESDETTGISRCSFMLYRSGNACAINCTLMLHVSTSSCKDRFVTSGWWSE